VKRKEISELNLGGILTFRSYEDKEDPTKGIDI
jgi:hypothetical protein